MATTFLTPYNNAETTVAVQLEIAGTSLTVADGSVFPASNFQISLFVTKGVWNPATDEIVYCSSRTGNDLDIEGYRAQEGTTARVHLVGAYVAMFPTAKYLSDVHTAVNALENAGYIANLVEDTTPQLGGSLDCQGNDLNSVGDVSCDELTIANGYGITLYEWLNFYGSGEGENVINLYSNLANALSIGSNPHLQFDTTTAALKMIAGVPLDMNTHKITGVVDPTADQEAATKKYVDDNTETTRTILFVIDGGGAAIATGIHGDIVVDYACTITQVTMLADQSGSIVVDIWKDSYANFPPTVADTITASAKPTLSTAIKYQDTTLTGWTKTITAGDTIRFNVDSVTTIQRVTIALKVTTG